MWNLPLRDIKYHSLGIDQCPLVAGLPKMKALLVNRDTIAAILTFSEAGKNCI